MTPAVALPPAVEAALGDASAALHRLYGDRLARLVLFGSYARGEARPPEAEDASDVDVLVVLRGLKRPAAEALRLGGLHFDLLLEHDVAVSFIPISEERAADPGLPLMVNVNREGIEL